MAIAMKLTLDLERCAGHGRCYELAHELVAADEDGRAVLVGAGEVEPTEAHMAALAVRNCPERALALTDELAP